MRTVVVVLALLGACGKDKPHGSGDPAGSADAVAAKKAEAAKLAPKAMARLTQLRDQMCACKTATCADKVHADMMKWSAETTPILRYYKAPKDELDHSIALSAKMQQCRAALTAR